MNEQDKIKREKLFLEINFLKAQLESSNSAVGDWKHNKQQDYNVLGVVRPYTSKEMKEYAEQRVAIRNKINDLQKQVAEIDKAWQEEMDKLILEGRNVNADGEDVPEIKEEDIES